MDTVSSIKSKSMDDLTSTRLASQPASDRDAAYPAKTPDDLGIGTESPATAGVLTTGPLMSPPGHSESEDGLHYETDTISQCLDKNTSMVFKGHKLVISYDQSKDANYADFFQSLNFPQNQSGQETSNDTVNFVKINTFDKPIQTCVVVLKAPKNKVYSVIVLDHSCSSQGPHSLIARYRASTGHPTLFDGCRRWVAPGLSTILGHQKLTDSEADDAVSELAVRVGQSERAMKLHILVLAVTCPPVTKSEVHFVSPWLGFLQSPRWDPDTDTDLLSTRFFSSTLIRLPRDHVAMVTVVDLSLTLHPNCSTDWLRLSQGQTEDEVWTVCGDLSFHRPQSVVLDADRFKVKVKVNKPELSTSESNQRFKRSYRIIFTFHLRSSRPQRSDSGQWNCTGNQWAGLRPHFLCNWVTECQGGEDELHCPYTLCRDLKGVAVQGTCYFLLDLGTEDVTWNQATDSCGEYGGRLAQLETVSKRAKVLDQLQIPRLLKRGQTVYIGLRTAPATFPFMYRYTLYWEGSIVDHIINHTLEVIVYEHEGVFLRGRLSHQRGVGYPARLSYRSDFYVWLQTFSRHFFDARKMFLCQAPEHNQNKNTQPLTTYRITFTNTTNQTLPFPSIRCTQGHLTHEFLSCDAASGCLSQSPRFRSDRENFGLPDFESCPVSTFSSLPPYFACSQAAEYVPYSLVCDHYRDCIDGGDEDFCEHPVCLEERHFRCTDGKCIRHELQCNGHADCKDMSDERSCGSLIEQTLLSTAECPPPPAAVFFHGNGRTECMPLTATPVNKMRKERQHRRDTYFECPSHGYFVPVFVRCNAVYDCPGHEDEAHCESYTCPDFYRCRGSFVCLHPDHLCDGWAQCPQQDDELFCGLRCPQNCTCHGHAFTCPSAFEGYLSPHLRYLDATGSRMGTGDVGHNTMLVHLGMARCNLSRVTALTLPNLNSLDLSYNIITSLKSDVFLHVQNLRVLFVAGNPLTLPSVANTLTGLTKFSRLDLSFVYTRTFDPRTFVLPTLELLNLSNSGIEELLHEGFRNLKSLQVLDLTGCEIQVIPRNVFHGVAELKRVMGDVFKLCCPTVLPDGFNPKGCDAPSDTVSSCEGLLKASLYRNGWWIVTVLTLSGNVFSLISWVHMKTPSISSTLLGQLSAWDVGTGVYLATIIVADSLYQGRYVWYDTSWRHSLTCQVCGFLFMMSQQMSSFTVVFITLERIMVIHFQSCLWGGRRCVIVLTLLSSVVAAVQAAFPLRPDLRMYSQSGLCQPYSYPFSRPSAHLFIRCCIGFNLAFSTLVAAGQMSIYYVVKSKYMDYFKTPERAESLSIARRLFLPVLFHCLRWFVAAVVLLTVSPGSDNHRTVIVSVFVLPASSALTPLLRLTADKVEDRRISMEKRLLKILTARTQNVH